MNIHVPKELKEKYLCVEFRGKPFKRKNGKTYVRAKHKTFNVVMIYCYEDDFIWFGPISEIE